MDLTSDKAKEFRKLANLLESEDMVDEGDLNINIKHEEEPVKEEVEEDDEYSLKLAELIHNFKNEPIESLQKRLMNEFEHEEIEGIYNSLYRLV